MPRTALFLLGVTMLLAAGTATAHAATGTAAMGCEAAMGTQTKTTKSFVFALHVGAAEQMWTIAQVKAKHPTSGEVIVGGAKSSATSMGGSARHLDVHICGRSSGKVVAGARPKIELTDETPKAMTVNVPVAVIKGVNAGAADLHYGNNVSMVTGHRYSVVMTLNGQRAAFAAEAADNPDWNMSGHELANTRSQPFENTIGAQNVGRLAPRWVVTTAGDVSATPAVVGDGGDHGRGAVYFPDWGGKLWKVDARTGAVVWSRSIADYTGVAGAFSRTTPVVDGSLLYLGDQNGSHVMAVDARTGDLRWITPLDPNKWSLVTGSPVVAGNVVLVSASSQENVQRVDPCCTFRGSLTALDKLSGKVVWKTYTLPDNGGQRFSFAGAGIANPPAVDVARGLVYVGTNSHNSVPDSVAQCLGGNLNGLPPNLIDRWSESCFPAGDYFSSVLALDLRTGQVRWSYRVAGTDAWQAACGNSPPSWCADPKDITQWDVLGSGPNVFSTRIGGRQRGVVGIGSRTGIYRLFDAGSGALLWATLVGPQFGIQWGTATDGARVYVSIANPTHRQYLLQPSGAPSTGGSWAALDPATGRILWQTAVPDGTDGLGPPTVANGVVYVGSMAGTGNQMYALDAATGAILWQYAAGGSVNAGAAVSRGSVFWGSGYARSGSGNNKLYAFSIDGG